jgi:hypothetical protein
MAKPKHIDNIEMSFTDPEPKASTEPAAAPTAVADDVEELKENGQLVYQKNKKSGDIKFFVQEDGKDVEVSLDVIDKLEKAYPAMPDRSYNGGKKKGDMQVRFTKEQFDEEKRVSETVEVPFEECDLISERQEYEDGEVITMSIVKKHLNLIKLLRGEIGG